MTKKDYIAIADVISSKVKLYKKEQSLIVVNAFSGLVDNLAKIMLEDNEKFEKQKFVKACGF